MNKHFHVPNLLSPIFTGQNEVLHHLENSLVSSRKPRKPLQRRFVLYGEGGSGKTQICLKYAQTYRERYWGVFWIDASSIEILTNSILQIGTSLDIDRNSKHINRTLNNTTQPWLLIFDNVDNPNLSLNQYFPTCEHGDVIITSRNLSSCKYNTVGCHELGQMSILDAETLLLKTVYSNAVIDGKIKLRVQKLVNSLARLAMSVAQAGTYIRETSCSLERYIELYQQARDEVLENRSDRNTEGFQRIVFATTQVSLNKIESEHDPISQSALRLLKLLSFYHHDAVPLTMMYGAWRSMSQKKDSNSAAWVPWPEFVLDFEDLRQSFQASVTFLESFSLINCDGNIALSLHPLVHNWCRTRLAENGQRSACRQALKLLSSSIEWSMSVHDNNFNQLLAPHVQTCLQYYHRLDEHMDAEMTTEWLALGLTIGQTGHVEIATQMLEEVVRIRMTALGGDHSDTLLAKHNLAYHYFNAGKLDQALQLEEQVVLSRAKTLGELHPDTLTSEQHLALYYGKKGDLTKALQLEEHVAHLRTNTLGPQHSDTIQSVHTLAIRFSQVGRQAEAIRLMEQLVTIRTKAVGEEYPDTLRLKDELVSQYGRAGLLYNALQLGHQVATTRAIVLGSEHIDTLRSLQNLASWYAESGQTDEALPICQQVIAVRTRKLGDDHIETLESIALLKSLAGNTTVAPLATSELSGLVKPDVINLSEVTAGSSRRKISRVWDRVR